MIIAAINNNKLFVQFDKIVKTGWIHIRDEFDFDMKKELVKTEFEIMEIPKTSPIIFLDVKIEGEKTIKKTVYHYE